MMENMKDFAVELEDTDLEDVNGGFNPFSAEDREMLYNRIIRFAKAHYASRIDAKTEALLKDLIVYQDLFSEAKAMMNEKGIDIEHIMKA